MKILKKPKILGEDCKKVKTLLSRIQNGNNSIENRGNGGILRELQGCIRLGGDMTSRVETSTPANTPRPIGPYSHIAKVGQFISIGGTAGVNPATGDLAGSDVYSQAKQILDITKCCVWSKKNMAYAEPFKFSLATKSKGGLRHMEDFTREFIASLIGKPLGEIVQVGAQKIVEEAVLAEFEIFMRQYSASLDGRGRQGVVLNGSQRERAVITAAGELNVKVPRVRDRRDGEVEKAQFRSSILPPYLRRAKEMDEFIPYLYLKGISTGDFSGVLSQLRRILGVGSPRIVAQIE